MTKPLSDVFRIYGTNHPLDLTRICTALPPGGTAVFLSPGRLGDDFKSAVQIAGRTPKKLRGFLAEKAHLKGFEFFIKRSEREDLSLPDAVELPGLLNAVDRLNAFLDVRDGITDAGRAAGFCLRSVEGVSSPSGLPVAFIASTNPLRLGT